MSGSVDHLLGRSAPRGDGPCPGLRRLGAGLPDQRLIAIGDEEKKGTATCSDGVAVPFFLRSTPTSRRTHGSGLPNGPWRNSGLTSMKKA